MSNMDQSFNTLTKIQPLQDKVLRVISFTAKKYDVRDLYKNDQTLKISDYIKMLNCLFVRDVLTNSPLSPIQNYFNTLDTLNKTLSYYFNEILTSMALSQHNTSQH